jgi:hypothetical protein
MMLATIVTIADMIAIIRTCLCLQCTRTLCESRTLVYKEGVSVMHCRGPRGCKL